jgi:3-hydroxyacyl-CoA dehydrogenase
MFIAKKIAYVLSGGDLSAPQWVDEQVILDLEREGFLSLLGQEKTIARIKHLLMTGKPLRN